MLVALAACSGGDFFGSRPEPPSPPPTPPAPPPPTPPPVDLAGRWRLAAAAGGACFMNFADTAPTSAPAARPAPPTGAATPPGASATASAVQGTIAPEGGCPGSFFTSRKWTFEDGTLIIRDFKNQPLARLSYAGDRFQGQDTSGGALTLSK